MIRVFADPETEVVWAVNHCEPLFGVVSAFDEPPEDDLFLLWLRAADAPTGVLVVVRVVPASGDCVAPTLDCVIDAGAR